MQKALALLALLGSAGTLLAADNATLITPCGTGCVTVRAKDVGLGVQSPVYILGDTSGNPIYGSAGTANANVLTVQGIASMTKLLVDGSGVTQPVSGTVTANQGGAWTVAATQSGTWTVQQGTPPWTVTNQQSNVQLDYDTGVGVQNMTLWGIALPASGGAVAGGTATNPVRVDPTGTTTQPVSGTVTANAGSGTFTVSGTVTANQGGAPWSENITQFGGVALSTGTGASGTGIPRVTVSNDSNVLATQSGSWTVTANQGTSPWTDNVSQFGGTNISTGTGAGGAGIPRVTVSNDSTVKVWDGTNTAAVKASGTNAATTDPALVVAPSPNPSTLCASVKPVNQTGSTDLVTSTNKLHICSIVLVSATAQNLSLVEGTGTTCATGIAALIGGTTASLAVAANGGFSAVSDRAWLETQTTADHLCLLQSGAGNVSGVITYTDHN